MGGELEGVWIPAISSVTFGVVLGKRESGHEFGKKSG